MSTSSITPADAERLTKLMLAVSRISYAEGVGDANDADDLEARTAESVASISSFKSALAELTAEPSEPTAPSDTLSPEFIEAIRERRAIKNDHFIAAHTKGGTYVIASSGRWNDNGRPRDLVAILPGDLGQGQVLKLYVAVNPAFVAELEAALA